MISIYIWKPGNPESDKWFHGKTGHVSMELDGKYYSFYPKDKTEEKSNFGLVYTEPAEIFGRSETMDRAGSGYEVDTKIVLKGLDENKIKQFWQNLANRSKHYHFIKYNCCFALAQALQAGFIEREVALIKSDNPHFKMLLDWTSLSRESWPSTVERIRYGIVYSAIVSMTPRLLMLFAAYINNYINGELVDMDDIRKQFHR